MRIMFHSIISDLGLHELMHHRFVAILPLTSLLLVELKRTINYSEDLDSVHLHVDLGILRRKINKTRRIEAIFTNVQRTKCGNASWDVVTCRLNNDSDGDHVANGLTLFQFPTLRQWADFGFFQGFAVQAVAEEAAQQR